MLIQTHRGQEERPSEPFLAIKQFKQVKDIMQGLSFLLL